MRAVPSRLDIAYMIYLVWREPFPRNPFLSRKIFAFVREGIER
jgi:hypothetical protein